MAQEEGLPLLKEESLDGPEVNEVSTPPKRIAFPLILSAALLGVFSFGRQTVSSQAKFSSSSASSSSKLTLRASRVGYSSLPQHTLDAYGLEMIVEPNAEIVLSVNDAVDGDRFEWTITPIESEMDGSFSFVDENADSGGAELRVKFTQPNSKFQITCSSSDGISTVSYTATTKRVRREIRALSSDDRQAYLSAVQTMFTTSQDEGVELYGHDFISHGHLTALHASGSYSYHGNLFFLTSHPAMQIKMEKSLLAINPDVMLPYWDFLLDSELAEDWSTSIVYSEDWFGPVDTSPEEDYRITGTFSQVKMIADPTWKEYPLAAHSLRDMLGNNILSQSSEYLQRSRTYCGFKSSQGFSTCKHVETCFAEFENGGGQDLLAFDGCLESYVHANLHIMHAGMWDCQVSWSSFFEENKAWLDRMLFSILSIQISGYVDVFKGDGYLSCSSCVAVKKDESCGCVSDVTGVNTPDDVHTALTAKARADMAQAIWEGLGTISFEGSDYVQLMSKPWADQDYTDVYVPMTGKLSNEPLSFEKTDALNSLIVKTLLFPGKYGIMVSGAAAVDPLFWVMHQMFDKATHALRLSPRYNKKGFVWNNVDDGMEWEGTTPFKPTIFEPYVREGELSTTSDGYLTNNQLWSLISPDSHAIDYVYDQMTNWGSCSFDPFESS